MKYIDADKLKSEIQSLIDLGYDKLQGNLYHVLSLIDSLQQKEPDKDLEEAAEKYSDKYCSDWALIFRKGVEEGRRLEREDIEKEWLEDRGGCFLDGVNEGKKAMKEQMMKDAVEGMIYQPAEHYWAEVIARYDGELKHGDKVRIIILPKEDGQ